MSTFQLQTVRVGLRKFKPEDLAEFAALNADPEVMENFPKMLTRDECQEFMSRINKKIDEQGFGFWAAELIETKELMGFVGITRVSFETEFTPAVEIGWRLARKFWGQGLATEAAAACLHFAFHDAGLDEVVSFTSILNKRSFSVMERIGMTRSGEFDHPKIDPGHRLHRHVLYKISKQHFLDPGCQ